MQFLMYVINTLVLDDIVNVLKLKDLKKAKTIYSLDLF